MPPKHSNPLKKLAKKEKKAVKKVIALKQIAGHGDYRPTQFQRVRGRGDYLGDLFGKVAGGLASNAGNWLQSKFRNITGFGDYRQKGPQRNSLLQMVDRAKQTDSQNQAAAGPSQNPFEMGAMSVKFAGRSPRIEHREYIGAVYAPANPADFNTVVYKVQPGISGIGAVFPWGSSVFKNFEQYILHGCIFEYVTSSTNYSSTTALGTVSLSTVYDAEAQPLASLMAVNNNEFTTSAPPSVSFYHPLECAPKDGATDVKFIRTSNASNPGTDERLDDFATFQVSTSGLSAPAGTKLGDIWGSYDIELRKAVLPDYHVGTTAQFTSATAAAMNAVWATSSSDPQNSLPATLTNVASAAGTSSVKVNMPVGYNGNYVALIMYTTNTGQNWTTNCAAPVITQWGSDFTFLSTLITGSAALAPGFSVTNSITGVAGGQCMSAYAFSTIANSAANNWFQFDTVSGGSAAAQKSMILIIPLDNDITDMLGAMKRIERANPAAVQLAKMMASYQELKQGTERAHDSAASSAPAHLRLDSSTLSDERWEEHEECKDLETSIHLDRKQLEALLASGTQSAGLSQKSLNQMAQSRSVPSL